MSRGRPREFDPDAALDQALTVFAHVGFEAASVQQLADAMGICKPSLYAAYGNKEALFIAALRRYAALHESRRAALLDGEARAEDAVYRLLQDAADSYTRCPTSLGCLLVAAASSAGAQSPELRDALAAALSDGGHQLQRRLERARDDGDLAPDEDVAALTAYFLTVMAGLSVQARSGASADQLRDVARAAMRAWPMRTSSARAPGRRFSPARPAPSSASRGPRASRN